MSKRGCIAEMPGAVAAHPAARLSFILTALGLALALLLVAPVLMPEQAAYAATVTVNTLADENDGSCSPSHCSLRDALKVAAAGDTIDFSVNGTIVLSHGQLVIGKDLTISGPGASLLTVSGNHATGVFDLEADATISGLTIANASSNEIGGGVFIRYSQMLTVTNCTFSGNHADGGGAIYNGGTLDVTGCTFSDNTIDLFDGAAIENDYTTTVKTSTFVDNIADDTYGGAIGNAINATLDVSDSTFSGNHSIKGGAIWNWGYVWVTNSTFSGNEALGLGGGLGGGIYSDGYLKVTNSTFAANTAMYGGGVYNTDDLLLYNCTFSGNSTTGGDSSGGGVYNGVSGQFAVNTIIASSPAGGNCNYPGMMDQGDMNMATDTTCGDNFTQTTADALKLAWQGWLFGLRPGSVAIDTGTNSYCPPTDQRGVSRPRDGDGNGSAICDVGSFEAIVMAHRVYLPVVVRRAP